MHPCISPATAELGANLLKTMSSQGLVPKTEAQAAAAILLAAAKKPKDEAAPTAAAPRLLTTAQAAERLTCSRKTVLRMADDGLLTRRYLRPGNAKGLRFAEAEVSALCGLADHEGGR